MSARNAMLHRCRIDSNRSRDAGTVTDSWGQDDHSDWHTVASDVPCRVWFQQSSSIVNGERVQVDKLMLLLPRTTNVKAGDRIVDVKDKRGRNVQPGTMRVDSLGQRYGHTVLSLTELT